MKIDATILVVGEEWDFKYVNPDIKSLTKFTDELMRREGEPVEDPDGHDADIWKLHVKFGKEKPLIILLKSKAAQQAEYGEGKEMFNDKEFCPKLVKIIVKELRKSEWIPKKLTEGCLDGWSFTGDCTLTFHDGKYGYDT